MTTQNKKEVLVKITGIVLLFLLLSEAAVSQAIYKWRDEKGKLHFGDSPPADIKAEILKTGKASVYRQEGLYQEIPKVSRNKTKTINGKQKKSESAACNSAKKWAENIRSQLRQPHSAQRGDYLKGRMRAANSAVRKNC